MPDPTKPGDPMGVAPKAGDLSAANKPGTISSPGNGPSPGSHAQSAAMPGSPPVDSGAALAAIAHSLTALAGQSDTKKSAPPPSFETRPGGRAWVNGNLVDAEGKTIEEKDDVKPK